MIYEENSNVFSAFLYWTNKGRDHGDVRLPSVGAGMSRGPVECGNTDFFKLRFPQCLVVLSYFDISEDMIRFVRLV